MQKTLKPTLHPHYYCNCCDDKMGYEDKIKLTNYWNVETEISSIIFATEKLSFNICQRCINKIKDVKKDYKIVTIFRMVENLQNIINLITSAMPTELARYDENVWYENVLITSAKNDIDREFTIECEDYHTFIAKLMKLHKIQLKQLVKQKHLFVNFVHNHTADISALIVQDQEEWKKAKENGKFTRAGLGIIRNRPVHYISTRLKGVDMSFDNQDEIFRRLRA